MSWVDDLYNEDETALRAMQISARRAIAIYVRDVRRDNVDGMRIARGDDVDVEMWHDEVDGHSIVKSVDHRADACRRNAKARRPTVDGEGAREASGVLDGGGPA